jgi:S1-C subfamily serine protease
MEWAFNPVWCRWNIFSRLDAAIPYYHFCFVRPFIASILFLLALAAASPAAEPEKSVIRITTFSQQPVWDAPWRFDPVRKASGSGFVINGKRIMTNAHVVSWAKQVLVYKYQDPRPYLARVAFIGHDCDLAVLEVEDETFFNGLEPLDFGELPKVRSTVITYGYPAGGEQISYTRGVVSRIELQTYVHIGNRNFLAVQTDAAINPGNSGGPVIQDDKVAGVSFQGMSGLENTGFFIPPPVIQHFLKDIGNGRYEGFPMAGLRVSPLQNPAFRKYLKLPDNDTGARVDKITPSSAAKDILKEDDVLLQVGPYAVGSDGSIMYQGNRVHVAGAFSEVQAGESVPLKIWRAGAPQTVTLTAKVPTDDRSEGNLYELPRYYVHAGLVFTPLSRDYLRASGPNFAEGSGSELIYELYYRKQESPETARTEPVVLAAVLSHPVNANLELRGHALVDKINGVRINKLEDVIAAFEKDNGPQDVIEFVSFRLLECLNRAEAKEANDSILKTYGIARDRRL